MGYIGQKLWDIFGKRCGIYRLSYGIYMVKLRVLYGIKWAKTMGYIGKIYGIYIEKKL